MAKAMPDEATRKCTSQSLFSARPTAWAGRRGGSLPDRLSTLPHIAGRGKPGTRRIDSGPEDNRGPPLIRAFCSTVEACRHTSTRRRARTAAIRPRQAPERTRPDMGISLCLIPKHGRRSPTCCDRLSRGCGDRLMTRRSSTRACDGRRVSRCWGAGKTACACASIAVRSAGGPVPCCLPFTVPRCIRVFGVAFAPRLCDRAVLRGWCKDQIARQTYFSSM